MLATARPNPWAFVPHPEVWALLGSCAVAYVVALRRLGPRLAGDGPIATTKQKLYFGLGMALLWIGADWPIHDLAERYLFSVHMVQHFLFSLIAPPFLLMGLPGWLLRRILSPRWLMRLVQRTSRPLVAALMFNSVIALSHWPAWVNATLEHQFLHFLAHLLLFTVSCLMWLPVVNTDPGLPILQPPTKMLYLFLQSIVPTVPAAFLAFAEKPVYTFYATVPRIWGLSVIDDQQLAGGIMKVGGSTIIWVIIAVIFFRWYANSERDKGDVLTWADVQREFERSEPAPTEPAAPR